MSATHKGLIIIKNKDRQVPEEFLKPALSDFPSGMSMTFATKDEEGKDKLNVQKYAQFVPLEGIVEAATFFAPQKIVTFLAAYPPNIHEDDIQPYGLLTDSNKVAQLVGFLEGDFSKYHKDDTIFSDAYSATEMWLKPKLLKIWKQCGQDMAKFIEELRDPVTHEDLMAIIKDGSVVLMSHTGEMVSMSTNENAMEFPWGWVSDTLDYVESYPEKEEVKEPERVSLLSQLKSKISGASKIAAPKVPEPTEEVESEKPVIAQPPVAPVSKIAPGSKILQSSTTAPTPTEDAKFQCPPNINGKNAIKAYYQKTVGWVPSNYKEKPAVTKNKPAALDSKIKDFKNLKAIASTIPVAQPQKEVTHTIEGDKETATALPLKQTGTEIKNLPAASTTLEMSILSAEEKKEFSEKFLTRKTVQEAMQNKDILDPKQIQEMEAKLPTIFEQMAIKGIEDTFNIPDEDLFHLARSQPKVAFNLLKAYRIVLLGILNASPVKEAAKPAASKIAGSKIKAA